MRRTLLLLVMALTVVAGGAARAAADLPALINADRRAAGLEPVAVAPDLERFAQQRADEMARAGRLSRTEELGEQVQGWERLGESVGRGRSLEAIVAGFVGSDTHRANLRSRYFDEVGAGVARHDGLLYVAVVYREAEVIGPEAPSGAPATRTFPGVEEGGDGRSPLPALVLASAAVGGAGLTVGTRRRRRALLAEPPPPEPAAAAAAVTPPAAKPAPPKPKPMSKPAPARRPSAARPPSSRVGRHKPGHKRKKRR